MVNNSAGARAAQGVDEGFLGLLGQGLPDGDLVPEPGGLSAGLSELLAQPDDALGLGPAGGLLWRLSGLLGLLPAAVRAADVQPVLGRPGLRRDGAGGLAVGRPHDGVAPGGDPALPTGCLD